jgi:hypothetical protein
MRVGHCVGYVMDCSESWEEEEEVELEVEIDELQRIRVEEETRVYQWVYHRTFKRNFVEAVERYLQRRPIKLSKRFETLKRS